MLGVNGSIHIGYRRGTSYVMSVAWLGVSGYERVMECCCFAKQTNWVGGASIELSGARERHLVAPKRLMTRRLHFSFAI